MKPKNNQKTLQTDPPRLHLEKRPNFFIQEIMELKPEKIETIMAYIDEVRYLFA